MTEDNYLKGENLKKCTCAFLLPNRSVLRFVQLQKSENFLCLERYAYRVHTISSAEEYGKFQRHRPPFDDVRRVGQTHLQDVPDKVGYHGKLGFAQSDALHRHRHRNQGVQDLELCAFPPFLAFNPKMNENIAKVISKSAFFSIFRPTYDQKWREFRDSPRWRFGYR